MAAKRSASDVFAENGPKKEEIERLGDSKQAKPEPTKKHTLDSDEDDSEDDEKYNILNDNDIEGEEDGCAKMDGEIKLTPFNMKEEQEEGHFDADGHFQWDKSKNEVRDNWLDNLEWVKPKARGGGGDDADDKSSGSSDSADDRDDEATRLIDGTTTPKRRRRTPKTSDRPAAAFDAIASYRRILELMKPGETIKRALQRLGGGNSVRLSSAERWRQKRAGVVAGANANAALVVELTELSNTILTKMGNMDVYEERYEHIRDKYAAKSTVPTAAGTAATVAVDELDMYADDFDSKEKTALSAATQAEAASASDSTMMLPPVSTDRVVRFAAPSSSKAAAAANETVDNVLWEFKWQQADEEVHTGFTSAQMQQWVEEGYFKEGVFVRKCGHKEAAFNSSARIDFELYM